MSGYMRELRRRVGNDLLEVPASGVVTFDARRRILLVRHAEGQVWTIPGGAIEPKETPADAAVRETWEETGLYVDPLRILGVYGGPEFLVTYQNGDVTSYLMVVFEGRVIEGEIRPDGVETLDVVYYSRDELAGLDLPPWLPIILHDAFERGERTEFRKPTWRPVPVE